MVDGGSDDDDDELIRVESEAVVEDWFLVRFETVIGYSSVNTAKY